MEGTIFIDYSAARAAETLDTLINAHCSGH